MGFVINSFVKLKDLSEKLQMKTSRLVETRSWEQVTEKSSHHCRTGSLWHILSYSIFIYYFFLYTHFCYLIENYFFTQKQTCVYFISLQTPNKVVAFRIFFFSLLDFFNNLPSLFAIHSTPIVNIVCCIKWTLKNSIIFLPIPFLEIYRSILLCLFNWSRNHFDGWFQGSFIFCCCCFLRLAVLFLDHYFHPSCNTRKFIILFVHLLTSREIEKKLSVAICRNIVDKAIKVRVFE